MLLDRRDDDRHQVVAAPRRLLDRVDGRLASLALRLARTARTRSICSRSIAGSTENTPQRMAGGSLNRLTPTTTLAPRSTACCAR